MNNFDRAFEKVIILEGGYSNHPYDPGGKTKYGITENTARAHGYKGDMIDLPLAIAKAIYKKSYWDINRLDQINNYEIQFELFDTGVNCGTGTALKFMQEAYNLLNKGNPLAVDGKIGPDTISALNKFAKPARVVKVANAVQGEYYLKLARKNEKNESFLFGWLDHRVTV